MNRDEAEVTLARARAMMAEAEETMKKVCIEHDQPIIREILDGHGAVDVWFETYIDYDETEPLSCIKVKNMNWTQVYDALSKFGYLRGRLLMGWKVG